MSAVVANLGPVFVTETGARSASVGGAYLSETAVNYVDLAGDLAPVVTLAADLTVVAAIGAGSVWSAADAALNGMTLTNGGLTVTPLISSSAWNSIRGTLSRSSGKWYVEFATSANAASSGSGGIGVANAAFTPGTYLGGAVASGGVYFNGNVYGDGSVFFPAASFTPFTPLAGDVVAIAIDLDGGHLWIARNNNWQGGDPVSQANPALGFYPATVFPAMAFNPGGASAGTWTIQPTAASQKYTPPAGFSAWDAPSGGTVDLAGDLSPSVTLAADVTVVKAPVDLAGDLTPSLAFVADLTVVSVSYVDLAGNFAPGVAFTADLTVAIDTRVYVDFSGNLGGVSQYGKLQYGQKHYSRIDAFAPAFSADVDIIGQIFFAGDLRPVVTFSGALSFAVDLSSGDLAPVVTFSGTIGLQADLSGDMAPQIAMGASLSLDLPLAALDGSFGFTVALAAPSLISGPLWASSEPCPAPPWTPIEPCPPSLWTPVPPPTFVPPSGGWTKQEEEDDLPVWGDAT